MKMRTNKRAQSNIVPRLRRIECTTRTCQPLAWSPPSGGDKLVVGWPAIYDTWTWYDQRYIKGLQLILNDDDLKTKEACERNSRQRTGMTESARSEGSTEVVNNPSTLG